MKGSFSAQTVLLKISRMRNSINFASFLGFFKEKISSNLTKNPEEQPNFNKGDLAAVYKYSEFSKTLLRVQKTRGEEIIMQLCPPNLTQTTF